MKQAVIFSIIAIILSSCYTKQNKPDYDFMKKIKELELLDSNQKTKILISPKKYYFGKLNPTNIIKGSFYIKNIGQRDFNYVSIKSNCNCIKTTYQDIKAIHPNDSLLINYEMNTKKTKGLFQNTIIAIGNCQFGNQTFYFEGNIY